MIKPSKGKFIYIVAGAFALVIVMLAIYLMGFGKAYQAGLTALNQKPAEEAALQKKKEVKKITIKKNGKAGCMEVTPNGIVRVYSECGGNLESASRLPDAKNILKLFRLVTENDLSKYNRLGDGEVYELTIETSEGSEKVYVVSGGNNPSPIGEIIQTIQNIQGDLPAATPSAASTSTPTSPPGSSPFPTPQSSSDGVYPAASPESGTGGSNPQPFVCGFSDSGSGTKPYRISNIVCSDEPSPAP